MLGFESLVVLIWLLGAVAGACLLTYIGTRMIINGNKQKLQIEASLAVIGSAGLLGLLLTFLASPAVVFVYLFGLLVGSGGMYFGARLYALRRQNSEEEGKRTESKPKVPKFYQNIGTANGQAQDGGTDPQTDSDMESRWGDRRDAVVETSVAALTGTVAMTFITFLEMAFPALAIGGGAIITALVLFLLNGRTYYAGGGTLYCAFSAAAIWFFGLPDAYAQSPFVVLLTLGGLSALIVAVQLGVGIVLQRLLAGVTGEKTALRIYEAVAAIVGLIAMIWTVITIHEKASRYGGITIGGSLGMVLNFLGIELPIPWIISDGIDAAMVMYVGAVLIGFHTLESLHTTWHATKQTAKSGVAAGKVAGRKSVDAASAARDRIDE